MAIKELPKDGYSKYMETKGLDICPVKLTGLEWLKLKIRTKLGTYYDFTKINTESDDDLTVINDNNVQPAK